MLIIRRKDHKGLIYVRRIAVLNEISQSKLPLLSRLSENNDTNQLINNFSGKFVVPVSAVNYLIAAENYLVDCSRNLGEQDP